MKNVTLSDRAEAEAAPDVPGPPSPAPVRRRPRPARPPLYAAIDLGTNNCRLLIARKEGAGFAVVDSFSRAVRLGEGLHGSGRLSETAMARAVEALKVCAEKIRRRGAGRVRAVATAACRAAANGAEFVRRIRRETGLRVEILDPKEEARLAVMGSAALVDPESDGAIVFDIGGGSTEIVWLRNERRSGALRIAGWASAPIGVVTLTDQVAPGSSIEAMIAVASGMVDQACRGRIATPARLGRFHGLGTSGTVTTLASIYLDLPRYDRARVDGSWMPSADAVRVIREIAALTPEGRAAHRSIGPDRSELILAGCAIFEAVHRRWPFERMRVADRGLREGILMGLIEGKQALKPGRKAGAAEAADTTPEGSAAILVAEPVRA